MLPLTPYQTVGPFFAILVPEQGRLSLADADAPQASASSSMARSATAPASRCPMPSSRSGRPTRPAAAIIRTTRAPQRAATPRSTGSAASIRTTLAASPWRPSSRGRCRDPTDRPQAPHLLVGLFARGLLTRLVTRIYFEDEPANRDDPILAEVAPDRRPTLIAARRGEGCYAHTITLQGAGETVFFDV